MWLMYSVLAATSFGLRGVFYHWASKQSLNRNTLLLGTFFMGALISLACSLLLRQEWTASATIGLLMGLFSSSANASMFKGFAVGKASLVAILTAMTSVVVVVLAYAMWGEKLKLMQLIAFIVIVAGILLVRYSNDISLRNLQGAQWGILAMLLFALNDLSSKWSTIMDADLFPTMFYMFVMGTCCFGGWWIRDRLSTVQTELVLPKWGEWKTFVVGMAVGITNALGTVFIVTAFDYGKAGLVSAVVALNVLIVLLYTRFVVKEKFTGIELTGMVTAFVGVLFLRLFGG